MDLQEVSAGNQGAGGPHRETTFLLLVWTMHARWTDILAAPRPGMPGTEGYIMSSPGGALLLVGCTALACDQPTTKLKQMLSRNCCDCLLF